MNSRGKILKQIRNSLHKTESHSAEKQLLNRILERPRGVVPDDVSRLGSKRLQQLFIEQARHALAKVEQIASLSLLPKLIVDILQQQQLPLRIRIANHSTIKTLPWDEFSELTVNDGAAQIADILTLTESFCGVAETGTLVLISSPESPTTLNFLTEINVVLLSANKIVAIYEAAWDLIREEKIDARVINFITGPSRTADIEQTVQIGIHGPKQLYIFIYP